MIAYDEKITLPPDVLHIPPPVFVAELPEIVPPVIVNADELRSIPPPLLSDYPVALLFFIVPPFIIILELLYDPIPTP